MCEIMNCFFSFALGMIVGGVSLYWKLLADIKAFEEEYKPVLLVLNKTKQNEV